MNRRQAIVAAAGLVAFGFRRQPPPSADFDPFFVWRQTARFDREVVEPIQRRFAMAMAEKLDREWGL